jgi:hypothetical protein
MGKHSSRGTNRVVFVCLDCLYLSGKTDACIDKSARWYKSRCDICHRDKMVLSAKDCGYFTPNVVAHTKAKLRELGLDRRTFANPEDVKNLVNVVQKVLGKNKSDATREALKDIIEKVAKGEPIEMYYAKTLTYHFTQDVTALKQKEIAVAKKGTGLIKKPSSGLVVVEGGQEHKV